MAFLDLNATAPGSAITLVHRCEPRRKGTGLHQIEKLAGRIKVEYRSQRDHRVCLVETRFPRMDGGSITAKHNLRHSIHVYDCGGHQISMFGAHMNSLGRGLKR